MPRFISLLFSKPHSHSLVPAKTRRCTVPSTRDSISRRGPAAPGVHGSPGLLLLALAIGPLFAQTTPADSPSILSPFEVNTSQDFGFAATQALAGGRLATPLKDTPVAYPVLTKEF